MLVSALPDPTTHGEAVARLKAIQARQEAAARRLEAETARRQAVEAAAASAARKAAAKAAAEARAAKRAARPPLHALVAIIHATARKHGHRVEDLLGRSRWQPIASARDEALHLVTQARPDLSLPALGRLFGGRDHTTILYALRRIHGPDYRHRPTPSNGASQL